MFRKDVAAICGRYGYHSWEGDGCHALLSKQHHILCMERRLESVIKPLQPFEQSDTFFFVVDIENDPDGKVLSIDSAWRDELGTIIHRLHYSWSDWCDWFSPTARDDPRFRIVYAHNGGGWDWLSLAQYLLGDGAKKRQTITVAMASSKMVTMTVAYDKQFSVHFCDSLQLLRSNLNDLGLKFVGEGKADTGGLLPHKMEWGKMLAYQRQDTELLLKVLETSLKLIREKVAKIKSFSYTIGSTAMRVFRTIGLKQNIIIPSDKKLKDFLRTAYTGGRVEVFRYGYYPKITVYDVNSLYPFAMLQTPVPATDRVIACNRPESSLGFVGVFRCTFNQRNRDVIPVLTVGGRGVYEGSGCFFSPELQLLREVDPSGEIRFHEGYKFLDTEIVFADYIKKLWNLRLEDLGGPLGLICKYLMNSLYGKMGQHSEREKLVVVRNVSELLKLGANCTAVDEEYGVWKAQVDSPCGFEHVGIAGMITSFARVCLYRGMMAFGFQNVVYCDTDSVHTIGEMNRSLVGTDIGQYKKEFEGEGVYAGKKLYALRDENGKEKIRAKGVSVGGINGCRLKFSDLQSLSEGGTFVAEFQQPTTALDVFKRKQSCKFGKRKRTLKKV